MTPLGRMNYPESPANPYDEVGTVTHLDGRTTYVQWERGHNVYVEGDLELTDKKVSRFTEWWRNECQTQPSM